MNRCNSSEGAERGNGNRTNEDEKPATTVNFQQKEQEMDGTRRKPISRRKGRNCVKL
jgi:hypothetical protein